MTIIKATQNGDGMVSMTSADFEALVTDLDRLKRLQPIANPNNQTKLASEGAGMNQTKAEQLAMHIEAPPPQSYNREISAELRRLAPIEAERDKLLAVNKVLVDALKLISGTEKSKFALAYCTNMATTALKLAGEIK